MTRPNAVSLRDQLLAALPEEERALARVQGGLQATLDALQTRCAAQAQAQGLVVDDGVLAAALARATGGGVALGEVALEDLYLAALCGDGDGPALRRFGALYGSELDRAIARSPTLGLSATEFRQLVFDRLFVSERAASPRIAQYVGRGPLKAWVRVMTSRLVIDLSRRRSPQVVADEGLVEKIEAADDTELDYLRHVYGSALDGAFKDAVRSLSVRERNLLRQRYLHEVPAEALATMYGVHRSTVFAWLEQARTVLVAQVRGRLAQRVPDDKLDSIVQMLGSKLQLSVRRLLDSRLELES